MDDQHVTSSENNYYNTEQGMQEWSEFFDAFREAGAEQRLAMAREQVEHNERFDAMWAEELMMYLDTPAFAAGRGRELVELLERMDEKWPQAVEPSRDLIAGAQVTAAVLEGVGEVEPALEALLGCLPRYIESILATTDMLMYYDCPVPLTQAMMGAWPAVRDANDLFDLVVVEYLNRALLASLATASRLARSAPNSLTWSGWSDSEPARSILQEFNDPAPVRRFVEHFTGERSLAVKPSALNGSDGEALAASLDALFGAFARHLVEDHGWPASRALLAQSGLRTYLLDARGQDADEDEGFRARSTAGKGARELKRYLRSAPIVVPDPFALASFLYSGGYGHSVLRPYMMGAIARAFDAWIDWLARHKLVERAPSRPLKQHFKRSLEALGDRLLESSGDRKLVADVRAALR